MDAVILAGGKGTRMDNAAPKPLVMVGDKHLIQHQIDYLIGKVDRIIVSTGHKAKEVEKFVQGLYPRFADGEYCKSEIYFSRENEQLGTAGGLKKALNMTVRNEVLAFNCDDITDIPISRLEHIAENTICVANPTLSFGRVDIGEDGYVSSFREKEKLKDFWISCGWYKFIVNHKFYDSLPEKGMLEFDVFPKMKLKAYRHTGFWKAINTRKDVDEFNKLPKLYQAASQ